MQLLKQLSHTNYGDIVVDLFGNHAPLTVENFIGLAVVPASGKHPTGEIMNTPCTGRRIPPIIERTSWFRVATPWA